MQVKYQCPDCRFKRMTKLTLLQRWWCSFCQTEKDIEKTIQEWAKQGYQKEDK
jgi:hypothetical protein